MQPPRLVGQGFHHSQLHHPVRQQPKIPVVVALGRRTAGEGDQVGLNPVVHLLIAVDLIAVSQHFIQSLQGVPPLGAEHGALRDVQGLSYLGSSPTLVCLQ